MNVEEAYDGLERLIFRGRDITSEFVSSWDPFLESLRSPFNPDSFVAHLERSVGLSDRHSLRGSLGIQVDRSQLRAAAYEIANATASSATWEQANIQGYLIQALLKCLEHDPSRTDYMADLMDLAKRKGAILASLNYDLVVEDVLTKASQTYDYGLSSWNEKKFVSFANSRTDFRLLKLHGSMDWFGNDDTIVVNAERRSMAAPLMVFGGASGKLRPDGPFLQLRHEFERELRNTNVFVVIGYAFGDGHLNAIVRRWVSTRRKAKMIIVNPAAIEFKNDTICFPYKLTKEHRLEAKTVDITHIKKKTAVAISDLISAFDRPIDLSVSGDSASYRGQIRVVQ